MPLTMRQRAAPSLVTREIESLSKEGFVTRVAAFVFGKRQVETEKHPYQNVRILARRDSAEALISAPKKKRNTTFIFAPEAPKS